MRTTPALTLDAMPHRRFLSAKTLRTGSILNASASVPPSFITRGWIRRKASAIVALRLVCAPAGRNAAVFIEFRGESLTSPGLSALVNQLGAVSGRHRLCWLAGGAGEIRNLGVTRSLAEGKRAQLLVIFRVELRWHPRENEFAVSSVGCPSFTLNSGVARMRLGRKIPSDELKSSVAAGPRTNSARHV